jgi:predicted phage terminase large subunit-like protein
MTGEANDFSVCTTWRMIRGDYYLVDVFRDRLQYPDLRRKIASLAVQYGAQTVLIENAGPGMTLLQDLHNTPPPGMPHPIGQKPNGSKADRVVAQSAKIEAGHVYLPRNAHWASAPRLGPRLRRHRKSCRAMCPGESSTRRRASSPRDWRATRVARRGCRTVRRAI